jgi:molybdopterin synthase catalytic subunit
VTLRAALVEHPLNIASLTDEVSSPACGATSVFLGTVRNINEGREVTGIEYTSYSAMAIAELGRIVQEAAERFSTERIVVEHRIGTLTLGDASVAIAVAHERRAPAMDASRYIIEQIKKRVPIWKREHYADGTREWVDPTRLPDAVEQTP